MHGLFQTFWTYENVAFAFNRDDNYIQQDNDVLTRVCSFFAEEVVCKYEM